MNNITILYIDDQIDSALGRYLDEEYQNNEFEITYTELTFDPQLGYASLINDSAVKSANIIFIDSRLFENNTITTGKFTGEEFKIILKKYYPFIEVIVITQNIPALDLGIISKYNPNRGKSANEYYANVIPEYIEKAVEHIKIYRGIANKLKDNDNWEDALKEKILNSLSGVGTYDELTKTDIDNLIAAFKEIQGHIND